MLKSNQYYRPSASQKQADLRHQVTRILSQEVEDRCSAKEKAGAVFVNLTAADDIICMAMLP